MDNDSSAVGASGVKAGGSGLSVVQIAAVLQDAYVGVNGVPQFMAQGRAEILHNKFITGFEIPAAASAFGDGEFHFHKHTSKNNARMESSGRFMLF